MNCVFDASCLINLINGDRICAVLKLNAYVFLIGPIVRSECVEHRDRATTLLQSGKLSEFSDQAIPASLFLQLLGKYNLGDGETECLAYCAGSKAIMASDDRRARNVALGEFGQGRVIGSLALLKQCVSEQVLTSKSALEGFELMKIRGAFLPDIGASYFDV